MIADIFRILGALYWVPAYQRGYYAREWYWLFRAAHSDGERAQVAANAVMMAHKLCPLDPRVRQERCRKNRILFRTYAAAVLFVIIIGGLMPLEDYIVLLLFLIPCMLPPLILMGFLLYSDRHRRGYQGMVTNGVGGTICFEVAWCGVMGDINPWLSKIPDMIYIAIALVFYVCPVFLVLFIVSAAQNFGPQPPACQDPPFPPIPSFAPPAAENTAGAAGALGVLFLAINGVLLLVFIHELDIIVVEELRHNLAGVFPFPAFLHQLL